MGFRPLHDRVLVRRVEADEKTAGGIIIPDTAKEKPQEGEVVAVGGGAKSDEGKITPLDVKAGDKILFGKWSGTEVKIDGEDLALLRLFLGGVGDDDPADFLFAFLDAADDDAVVERSDFHVLDSVKRLVVRCRAWE